MPTPVHRELTIWRLTDGKAGHEKQSLGLARALGRLAGASCHDLRVGSGAAALRDWLLGRFPAGRGLPDPDLILAAGHATHLPALAARHARGGRIVVLMRPSLPLALFDLCLIPEHDRPPQRENVVATRGVLNAVSTCRKKDPARGLILIGGGSSHYRWDSAAVIEQVGRITTATPGVSWRLTTSRRTPADFLHLLSGRPAPNLEVQPHTQTPPGWLEEELGACAQVWVTQDSVSMLYEALTAGCGVGLLRLAPVGAHGRLKRGIRQLLDARWVTPYEDCRPGEPLPPPPQPFNEAERCARLILERWYA